MHARAYARSCVEIASSPGECARWSNGHYLPAVASREISRMTIVFVRLERLVSILAVRPIAPLSFPFRSSESGNAVSRRMSPLTILTNCKNAHMTDNGQKSRFILEEMFRTVIEIIVIPCYTRSLFPNKSSTDWKRTLANCTNVYEVYMVENEEKSRFVTICTSYNVSCRMMRCPTSKNSRKELMRYEISKDS